MLREIPPVVALVLLLGVAPASAQPAPAPPDGSSTAARTLEQNRRVLVGPPAQPEIRGAADSAVAPAARVDEARAAPPAAGRAGSAAGGRLGARGGG